MYQEAITRIKSQFSHFNRNDFNPGSKLFEAIAEMLYWVIPAVLFVFITQKHYPDVEFYKSAMDEGIGPNLWNAIGSFGLFAFGIAIALSKEIWPSKIARNILQNTYSIGCLTIGLIIGQFFSQYPTNALWWQHGLFGVTSVLLIGIVILYNLSIWYLGFLIQNSESGKSSFLTKLEQMHSIWKVIIGTFIALLITLIFLSET